MDIFTDLISVCKIISVELQHIIALVLSGIGDTEIENKLHLKGLQVTVCSQLNCQVNWNTF